MVIVMILLTVTCLAFSAWTFYDGLDSVPGTSPIVSFGVSATFAALALFLAFVVGDTSVTDRWSEHMACEDGITEVDHAVIQDCDAYYNAPKVE